MNYKTINLKTDGDFAVLTLNRPERLNSLAEQLSLEAEIQLKPCDEPEFIGGVMKFLKKSS